MATKKTKADTKAADDELDVDELFSGIGNESTPKRTPKPKSAASKVRSEQPQQDKLAELENLLGDQPARPHTPRIKETASKRSSTATPPPGAAAGRLSEDRSNLPRKSGESSRSIHASFTPSATSSDVQDAEKKGPVEQTSSEAASSGSAAAGGGGGGGGGWWGGIFATASATATAAMKQAEAAYKEIQQNEEAQKYLEQVRGNVSVIRGYGKSPRGVLHESRLCRRDLYLCFPPVLTALSCARR